MLERFSTSTLGISVDAFSCSEQVLEAPKEVDMKDGINSKRFEKIGVESSPASDELFTILHEGLIQL